MYCNRTGLKLCACEELRPLCIVESIGNLQMSQWWKKITGPGDSVCNPLLVSFFRTGHGRLRPTMTPGSQGSPDSHRCFPWTNRSWDRFRWPSSERPESCSVLRSVPPWAGPIRGRPGWRWAAGVGEEPAASPETEGGCRDCWPGCHGTDPGTEACRRVPAGTDRDLRPDGSEPVNSRWDCCKGHWSGRARTWAVHLYRERARLHKQNDLS